MSKIQENVRQRHSQAVKALQDAVRKHVPPDQRAIILVYDGPEVIARELSWMAPHQQSADVKLILKATAEQIS